MNKTDEFLEHYGVPGMKWGRRKSSGNSAVPRPVSEDYATAKAAKDKKAATGLNSLSNKEIQAVITRTNLERQYKSLNPNVVKRGETYVKTGLGAVALASSVYALRNNTLVKKTASLIKALTKLKG